MFFNNKIIKFFLRAQNRNREKCEKLLDKLISSLSKPNSNVEKQKFPVLEIPMPEKKVVQKTTSVDTAFVVAIPPPPILSSTIRFPRSRLILEEEEKGTTCIRSEIYKALEIYVNSDEITANGIVAVNYRLIGIGIIPKSFRCDHKLNLRIIPFFDKYKILSAVKVSHYGTDNAEKDDIIGITNGASSIICDCDNPESEICSVCTESSLTAAEVLLKKVDVAEKLGLKIVNSSAHSDWQCNCRVTSCAKYGELVSMPILPSIKQIIIILDNEGYNSDHHLYIIKFVEFLITKHIKVKIIFPMADHIGGKIKLNDVLCKQGIDIVANILSKAVTINSKLDLEPSSQPLQALIKLLQLKEHLKNNQEDSETFIEIIDIYIFLKKHEEAEKHCCKAISLLGKSKKALEIKAKINHKLGEVYYYKGKFKFALNSFFISLQLSKWLGKETAKLYIAIGKIYQSTKDYLSAYKYYIIALNLNRNSEEKNNLELSEIYLAFGDLYFENGDYENSEASYNESLESAKDFFNDNSRIEIAKIYSKLVLLFARQYKYMQALQACDNYIKIMQNLYAAIDFQVPEEILFCYAESFLHTNNNIESIRQSIKNFPDCIRNDILKLIIRRAHKILISYQKRSTILTSYEIIERNKRTQSLISEAAMWFPSTPTRNKDFLNYNTLTQVVIDIEATGLGKKHKITEIAAIKLVNYRITGEFFHEYINPERKTDVGSYKITGLTYNFLQQYRTINEILPEFLEFIKAAELVMHDSSSDLQYINSALKDIKHEYIKIEDHYKVVDTLKIAKELHPNKKNNLTALCERYGIETGERTQKSCHGALLDAMLTAEVYIAMFNGEIMFEKPEPGLFYKL